MSKTQQEMVNERACLLRVGHHENIATYYGYFERGDYFYAVLEFYSKTLAEEINGIGVGDHYDEISFHPLEADMAKKYARDIAAGLMHLHSHDFGHTDIKPDNILIKHGTCIICDFGLVARWQVGTNLKHCAGTLPCMPPKILLEQPYDAACDMWSFGVTLYEMVTGNIPFLYEDYDEASLYWENIVREQTPFKPTKRMRKGARFLIGKLLQIVPTQRISAKQVLSDKWLVDVRLIFST